MRGIRLVTILLLPAFLWSCTNAGFVPPQNIASLLTPQASDTATPGATDTAAETGFSDETLSTDTETVTASVTEGAPPPADTSVASVETLQASTSDTTAPPLAVDDTDVSGSDEKTAVAQADTSVDTKTALAPQPQKAANPFAAFLKSQGSANRPRADVGDDRQQARSTYRKPAQTRQVARLTVSRTSSSTAQRGSADSLPGVNIKNVFAIDEEESGESDYLADSDNEAARVASLTNMARRGDHGLLLQREGVAVGCFPPALLTILRSVETKFGRTPVITSGYRSPEYNRKISGAKKSLHMRCFAADIQVQGVSKWTLAEYLRSLPGRGGVGTYCHTLSVHIDIGTQRDWNRRCRRKKEA